MKKFSTPLLIGGLVLLVWVVIAFGPYEPPQPMPPSGAVSTVVFSGDGLHGWWWLFDRFQTLISGIVGFLAIAIVGGLQLRQLRKSQKTQAELDRSAQEDHWKNERALRQRQWREDQRRDEKNHEREREVLAAALAAELEINLINMSAFLENAKNRIERLEKLSSDEPIEFTVGWEIVTKVLEANLNRLGLLGTDLTSQIVRNYDLTSMLPYISSGHPSSLKKDVEFGVELADEYVPKIRKLIKQLTAVATPEDLEPKLPIDEPAQK